MSTIFDIVLTSTSLAVMSYQVSSTLLAVSALSSFPHRILGARRHPSLGISAHFSQPRQFLGSYFLLAMPSAFLTCCLSQQPATACNSPAGIKTDACQTPNHEGRRKNQGKKCAKNKITKVYPHANFMVEIFS